jgi:hypothetical protein
MTQDQFDIINRRLDQLLAGQAELQGDAKSLAANVGRLSAKVEALPTLLDIYAGSFRLLALTFLPIWAVLLAGMLVIRWS